MAADGLTSDESRALIGLKKLLSKEATVTTNLYTTYTTAQSISTDANVCGVTIYNGTDTDSVYVLVGDGTVSSTNYTTQVEIGALYETPYYFHGNVSVIQSGATAGRIAITVFKQY